MGVFTDVYDLSSIGLVLPLVLTTFGFTKLTGLQIGLLAGSALVGAGALIFGALAQNGRKKYYGLDVIVMGSMALAQAFDRPGIRCDVAHRCRVRRGAALVLGNLDVQPDLLWRIVLAFGCEGRAAFFSSFRPSPYLAPHLTPPRRRLPGQLQRRR